MSSKHENRIAKFWWKEHTYQEKEMNGHDIWKQYYKKVAAQSWDPDNLGYRAKCTSAIDHEDQLNKVQLNTN